MNNLGQLVKQYNRFIADLGLMVNDIHEIIENEFKLEYAYEFWSPRDRAAWPSKQRYSRWYTGEKMVLYISIDLLPDKPCLIVFKSNINTEKTELAEFSESDAFSSIENTDIEHTKVTSIVSAYQEDWGDCCFCKIDLESISSNHVINSDLKQVIKCLLEDKYEDIRVEKLKFTGE
jgi:hypothetical protein